MLLWIKGRWHLKKLPMKTEIENRPRLRVRTIWGGFVILGVLFVKTNVTSPCLPGQPRGEKRQFLAEGYPLPLRLFASFSVIGATEDIIYAYSVEICQGT